MVQACDMLIIRENRDVFRILATDRQTADQFQKSGLLITFVYTYRIITCIGAEQMLFIGREPDGAGRSQLT